MQHRRTVSTILLASAIVALTFGSARADSDWSAITKRCAAEYPSNPARQVSCITEERDSAGSRHDDAVQPARVSNGDESCKPGFECRSAVTGATIH